MPIEPVQYSVRTPCTVPSGVTVNSHFPSGMGVMLGISQKVPHEPVLLPVKKSPSLAHEEVEGS